MNFSQFSPSSENNANQFEFSQAENQQVEVGYGAYDGMSTRRNLFYQQNQEINLINEQYKQKHDSVIDINYEEKQNNVLGNKSIIASQLNSQPNSIISQQIILQDKCNKEKQSKFVVNQDLNINLKEKSNHEKPKKQTNILNKVKFVKQFQSKIMKNVLIKKQVKQQHLLLINDKAINVTIEKQRFFNNLHQFTMTILNKIPIFLPDNAFLICWEFIILLACIIQIIFVPMHICFKPNQQQDNQINNLDIGLCIIFTIDIIFSCNKAYSENLNIIIQRSIIVTRYLQNEFIYDFVPTIFMLIEINWQINLNINIIHFVYLIRFKKYLRIKHKIIEDFHLFERFSLSTQLTNLILLIFFIIHYFGLGFLYIALSQDEAIQSWIDEQNLRNQAWYKQYINSIYFSVIQMCTIGFGDIVPISINEKIYCIIVSIISCGIFGYSLNQIGNMFKEINEKNAERKQQKYELLKYMSNRSISNQIKTQVLQYVDFLAEKEELINSQGQQLLQKLPINIRKQLQKDYYGKILQSNVFLKLFSPEFLGKLTQMMKDQVLSPNELLFSQGDQDNRLFFIQKGLLQVYTVNKSQESIYGFIQPNQGNSLFELQNFILGEAKHYNVISKDLTHIIYFTFEDFLNVMRDHPRDYELFCFFRDQILHDEMHSYKYCIICQKQGHQTEKCIIVNYHPNKQLVLLKNNYSIVQMRQNNPRMRRKKNYKALSDLQIIKNNLKDLRISLVQSSQQLFLDSFLENYKQIYDLPDRQFLINIPTYQLVDVQLQNSHENSDSEEMCSLVSIENVIENNSNNKHELQEIELSQLSNPRLPSCESIKRESVLGISQFEHLTVENQQTQFDESSLHSQDQQNILQQIKQMKLLMTKLIDQVQQCNKAHMGDQQQNIINTQCNII